MAEQFYTILTAVGKAKIANAAALGEKVELTEMALGDGGGSYYDPTEDQTELRNEVWRGAIGTVDVDEENPNWITIQTVVPSQHGGFMIREAGVFDIEGDLIAVGKYPETYKPVPADGSIKDLVVRMILEISNAASVVLEIDPTVVLATQQQVNAAEARAKAYTDQEVGEIAQELAAHKADKVTDATKNPHGAFTEFADRAVNVKWFGAVGDGVTDDTQAFLDLSNYLINNGGGIVYIPKGEYILNDIFKIPSNTLIFGSGNSTVIKAKEGADDLGKNIALFANADRINGNKNITIMNLKLDIQKDLQTRRNNSLTCLDFYNSEFIKIINVTAEGSIEHEHAPLDTSLEFPVASAAIFFRRTSRSIIENCHVLKSDYDGIALWEASNYNLVKDNYIEQTGYDYTSKDLQSHIGAGIQETANHGTEICVGNKYINNTVIGYKVVNSNGDILENNCFISHSGLQLLLQGNHFYNSYGDAIRILSHTTDDIKNQLESLYGASDFTGFTITGNHIENVFKSVHEADAIAIHIKNPAVSKGIGYSNVNISDNVIVNSEGGGIHIEAGYNMTIQGNILRYINTGNYSDAAIKNKGVANATIQGNVIADVGNPLRTGYGIYLVDYPTSSGTKEPRRNIITGNVMRNSEGFLIESVTGQDPTNWNYIETNNIDD